MLTRSRWAVIQTGLITTGLALFGVYVLANRINEEHVMTLYVWRWIPAGPWIVGTIAGSGYAIASWWLGAPVRGVFFAAILALQAGAYVLGHYTDLQSMDLVYRDTREPVSFADYYHLTTVNLGHNASEEGIDDQQAAKSGYGLRVVELAVFCMGAAGAGMMLVGSARCGICRGAMKGSRLGVFPAIRLPSALPTIEHFTSTSQAHSFLQLLHDGSAVAPGEEIVVQLCRCRACGEATIELQQATSASGRKRNTLHTFPVTQDFADAVLPAPTPVVEMT